MTVQITMTFGSPADAAAFLAGRPSQPASASSPAPAPKPAANAASAPTAASASPAAAPEQKAESSAKPLDFDTDVIQPMKEHFKKLTREQAVAFLANLGVAKPADLKDKGPEVWAKAVAAMKG